MLMSARGVGIALRVAVVEPLPHAPHDLVAHLVCAPLLRRGLDDRLRLRPEALDRQRIGHQPDEAFELRVPRRVRRFIDIEQCQRLAELGGEPSGIGGRLGQVALRAVPPIPAEALRLIEQIRRHFSRERWNRRGGPPHGDCLDLFGELCQRRISTTGNTLAELLHPYGRPLADWLQPVGGGAFAPQARNWFEAWGMDLKELGNDREARNESSYRPGGLPSDWSLNAREAIAFVTHLWEMFEPSGTPFEQIDQHLMRTAFDSIFETRTTTRGARRAEEKRSFFEAVVRNQALAPAMEERWISFLLHEIEPLDPALITMASNPTRKTPQDAMGVISRACLLLRAATGLADRSLGRAGIGGDEIVFWKEGLLAGRGLWQPGEVPTSSDLWSDIRDAAKDVNTILGATKAEDQHFRHFTAELAGQISLLGTCERIALWGIAPTMTEAV